MFLAKHIAGLVNDNKRMDLGQPAISAIALFGCNILFNQAPMKECLVFSPLIFTIIPIAMLSILGQTSFYLLLFPYDKFPDGINKSNHGICKIAF